MNKSSSRIGSLTEQLERLFCAEKSERDLDQLRYVTLKMYQLLQNQEKGKKDVTHKILEKTSTLLGLLEGCNDPQLILNILGCLLDLSTGGKKTIGQLVDHGTIDVLLQVIKIETPDQTSLEEILVLTHSILAKIGSKDRKFALKTRLTGSLQVTIDVIARNFTKFKVLHPALLVVKLSAGSSVNCSVLDKAGFVAMLFKIVSNCGHKRVTTLKLVLDLIAILVKSKSVAVKAVNFNGVDILIRMFNDWHRTDHHNRQTGIRKALLNSVKALIATKVGKTAFVQCDGMKTLFVFGTDTLDCKELDGINNVIVQILRLGMPDSTIPSTNPQARVIFQLPKTIAQVDSGSDKGYERSQKDSDEEESSPSESEEEDGRVTESQDDSETTTEKDSDLLSTGNRNLGRNKEDILAMYHQFFPEINLCKGNVEESVKTEEKATANVKIPIVIPTGSMEFSSPCTSSNDLPSKMATSCSCEQNKDISNHSSCVLRQSPIESDQPPHSTPSCEECRDVTTTVQNESTNKITSITADQNVYVGICNEKFKVKSISQFIEIPAPDVFGHYPPLHLEPLYPKKSGLQRMMLLKDVERVLQDHKLINKVIYDLDCDWELSDGAHVQSNGSDTACSSSETYSSTSLQDGQIQHDIETSLVFESKFECGNLRKAIQIYEREYDLILNSDVNCNGHHQWFYFEVSNMEENVPYKFNIINCEKVNSQFNFGMQPVLYSCKEAQDGDPGWVRTGTDICYYKNHYKRSNRKSEREKFYFTLTFTIEFPCSNDHCYLAYHYPYSFSLLENHFLAYELRLDNSKIFYRRQVLCGTLTGNPCYLVTITSTTCSNDNRPYIFLCSRVHPGESNASWVMKGVLDFLLSNKITARLLREMFVFKIIPMLNPDGVVNGCHRCSLSGADLNRQWVDPDPVLHPSIYHAKGLLLYLQALNKKPLVFCDFHGHSRKKNVFIYGCHNPSTDIPFTMVTSGSESDSSIVGEGIKDTNHRTLPKVLHSIAPAFSLQSCSFVVESTKESTGRVVVWRELGIVCSYTMESSYCGADQGPYKGFHLGTKELEEMGRCFCAGLLKLGNNSSLTRLLGSIQKSTMDDQSLGDDFLFRNSDLFAPVDTFPYEGPEYATQLLV